MDGRDRPESSSTPRSLSWLERWLVPGILVAVAILQLILAHTANLSPWKGGGFGMFAAIDSPSMRTLAAEGLDQNGELIRFGLLSELDLALDRRMRVWPRRSDLEILAPQLIGKAVVPRASNLQLALGELQLEHPSKIVASENDVLTAPFYRLATGEPSNQGRSLRAVRLQWWRLKFDSMHYQVYAEPLSQPVEAGVWGNTSIQP